MIVWKDEIKWKRGRDDPFFKKSSNLVVGSNRNLPPFSKDVVLPLQTIVESVNDDWQRDDDNKKRHRQWRHDYDVAADVTKVLGANVVEETGGVAGVDTKRFGRQARSQVFLAHRDDHAIGQLVAAVQL